MPEATREALDQLLTDILSAYIVDGTNPPEVVPIPEVDGDYEQLSVLVSSRTAAFLAKVAEGKGISKEAAARSILNVVASFVYRSAESRHKG